MTSGLGFDDRLFEVGPGRQVAAATSTESFGTPPARRNHDASTFYDRFGEEDDSRRRSRRWDPSLGKPIKANRVAELMADPVLNRFEGPSEVVQGDACSIPVPDMSVALVVTSPPYFVGKDYELGDDSPQSWGDYLDWLADVWDEQYRILEPGGRIAINVTGLGRKPYRHLPGIVAEQLEEAGFLLRGEIVWVKAEGSSSMAIGTWCSPQNPVMRDLTERVIVASRGSMSRFKSQAERQELGLPHVSNLDNETFLRDIDDLWRIRPELASKVGHPAPFPVELPERLIRLHTYEDDLVVDPMCGSGSTLIAAQRLGRRWVGVDRDPSYIDLAKTRLGGVTPQLRLHAAPNRKEVEQ